MNKVLLLAPFLLCLAACNNGNSGTTSGGPAESSPIPAPKTIGYSVVNTYPHDTSFFTEGFEFHNGELFESSGSGSNGEDQPAAYPSAFGIADLKTGKVSKKAELNNTTYFGEGITFFNDKIYQLTWKNQIGFVYDAKTFKKLSEFHYTGEGWSLTHDSTRLIMSDGSSNIRFLEPNTLKVLSVLGVTDNNGPVSNINELEYVDGFLYANQWETNYILKIDLGSGLVVGRIDLDSLEAEAKKKFPGSREMNGIAWHPATNTLYITGKCWPSVYEIKLN
ncbi:MAG: glutaminyl-peptide cyclotransferase [Bacteroidetes bacterium]|nr:glutaminyl-peptide cyclotransferase [Bacteroidota bacterium]